MFLLPGPAGGYLSASPGDADWSVSPGHRAESSREGKGTLGTDDQSRDNASLGPDSAEEETQTRSRDTKVLCGAEWSAIRARTQCPGTPSVVSIC